MRRTYLKLKTLLPALAVALLLVCSLPAALGAEGEESAPPARSGTCGDGLTWSLEAGTLIVEGSGDMTDFMQPEDAPWYGLREEILRLSLPDGLTSVGDLAFYKCENLAGVTLPDSVTQVGGYAFAYCDDMTVLDLGDGLQTIGDAAFSDCYALTAIDLPDTLTSIGLKGFYRCEAVSNLKIPTGVTEIGTSAFGYCKDLVFADVQASVAVLPEFMFYGCESLSGVVLPDGIESLGEHIFRECESLNAVYYGGERKSREEIETIVAGEANVGDRVVVGTGDGGKTAVSDRVIDNGDGTVTLETTTAVVGQQSGVTTRTEYTYPAGDNSVGTFEAGITATIHGTDGWEELRTAVDQSLTGINDRLAAGEGQGTVNIDLYMKDVDTLDQTFVDNLAGRDVSLSVATSGGSSWKVDCSQLEQESLSGEYDLSCTLSAAPQEICAQVGSESVFLLRFHSSAQVNAEVVIALGGGYARRNATLFKMDDGELTRYQTVVVDGSGRVHFYLASVTNEADYYIAMDLAAENDDAIIPDELLAEYGAETLRYQPIEYEITGRTSSWGMTINQVTWIMVGVLVVVVVAVGVTMFLLNKRKLKMGYVPDLDDED